MPRVKNISGGQLDVPVLGRGVADGEIIDAPDVQADGESPLVWPPDKWEPVPADKPARTAAAADSASGKADS